MCKSSRVLSLLLAGIIAVAVVSAPLRASAVVAEAVAVEQLAQLAIGYASASGVTSVASGATGALVTSAVSADIAAYAAAEGTTAAALSATAVGGATLASGGTILLTAAASAVLSGIVAYLVNKYALASAPEPVSVQSGTGYYLGDQLLYPSPFTNASAGYHNFATLSVASVPAIDWSISEIVLQASFSSTSSGYVDLYDYAFEISGYKFFPSVNIQQSSAAPGGKYYTIAGSISPLSSPTIISRYGDESWTQYCISNGQVHLMGSSWQVLDLVRDVENTWPDFTRFQFTYNSNGYLIPMPPVLFAAQNTLATTYWQQGLYTIPRPSNFTSSYMPLLGSSVQYNVSYNPAPSVNAPSEAVSLEIELGNITLPETLPETLTAIADAAADNRLSSAFSSSPPSPSIPDWSTPPTVEPSYPDGAPSEDFPDVDPSGLLLFPGTLFVDIWHYILEILAYGSTGLDAIRAFWDALPYAAKLPLYGSLVITFVFGLFSRLLM